MRLSTANAASLASACELYALIDADAPGSIQIEIGKVAREQILVGQTRTIVGRGESSDRKRLVHGVADGLRRQVRGARVPRCWPM